MKKSCVLFAVALSLSASILPLVHATTAFAKETYTSPEVNTIPSKMKMSQQESDKYKNYEKAIQNFEIMQQKITDSMTIDTNNHYVYNEKEIKNIVYSFNFENLNKNTKLNYTKETFFALAMDSIKSTEVKIMNLSEKNGDKYNVNAVVEVWNGKTFWMDYYNTKVKESQYQNLLATLEANGQGIEFIGNIPDLAVAIGPELSAVMETNIGALGSLFSVLVEYAKFACKSAYLRLVEANLSEYGTVLDLNKFTFSNQVWTQKDKPYQ